MTDAHDWTDFAHGAETLTPDNISRAVKGLPLKARLALRGLLQMQHGALAIQLPDGRKVLVRGKSDGPKASVKLRNWNLAHKGMNALKYGQSQLDNSDEMDLEQDRPRYDADRAKDVFLSGAHGIDAVMKAERLDALLFPIGSGAILSARPGYPTVIVPFAMVENAPTPPFPQGFNARPMPFGVSFAGGACAEPRNGSAMPSGASE